MEELKKKISAAKEAKEAKRKLDAQALEEEKKLEAEQLEKEANEDKTLPLKMRLAEEIFERLKKFRIFCVQGSQGTNGQTNVARVLRSTGRYTVQHRASSGRIIGIYFSCST